MQIGPSYKFPSSLCYPQAVFPHRGDCEEVNTPEYKCTGTKPRSGPVPNNCGITGKFRKRPLIANSDTKLPLLKRVKNESSTISENRAPLWDRPVKESRQVSDDHLRELILNGTLDEEVLYEVDSLLVADCAHLHTLSGNISVNGVFFIRNCPNLHNLSANIFVKSGLYINGCPRLERVAGSIFCDDAVYIQRAKSLKDVSAVVCAESGIFLGECGKLEGISGTINVKNSLDLRCCKSLKDLTGRFTVGGDLILECCYQLTNLSGAFSVGGNINLVNCARLTSLPDWIPSLGRGERGLRIIDLDGSGLSKMSVDELRSATGRDMMILFDESEVSGKKFHEFDQAFVFWRALASSTVEIPELDLFWEQERDLVNFLEALTGCDDYINELTRSALARRVMGTMPLLLDSQLQENALEYISRGAFAGAEECMEVLDDLEILALSCTEESLPPCANL